MFIENDLNARYEMTRQATNWLQERVTDLKDKVLQSERALQAYRERQRLDQDLTVGFSDKVTRLFGSGQPLLATGRNLGLLGLDLLPPAKRWFARQAMGLGTRPDPQGK